MGSQRLWGEGAGYLRGVRSRDLDLCSRTSGTGLCFSSPAWGGARSQPLLPAPSCPFALIPVLRCPFPDPWNLSPVCGPNPRVLPAAGCRKSQGCRRWGERERGSHLPFPVTTGTAGKNLQLLIWSPPGFLAACLIPAVSATLASPSPSPRP